jgi:hypothetical protein
VVNFELFRPVLAKALKRSDGRRGGRPPYDPVLMLKILVLQALYSLSDDACEFQIGDARCGRGGRGRSELARTFGVPEPSIAETLLPDAADRRSGSAPKHAPCSVSARPASRRRLALNWASRHHRA